MIGLDTLSDNIISANFPDEDDKLFDANEYNGLNQGPDPDMGLHFQSRKD